MEKTDVAQGPVDVDVMQLRRFAEDLHSLSGHNKYAAALSLAADEIERLRASIPGAVLAYRSKGHNKPCGQTIGANGAGEFAVLIQGNPEDAWSFAGEYLRNLERNGHRIEEAILVPNEEGFGGPAISSMKVHNGQS